MLFWLIRRFLNQQRLLLLLIMLCLSISVAVYYIFPHTEWIVDRHRDSMMAFPYYFAIMLLGAFVCKSDYVPQGKVLKSQIVRFSLVIGIVAIVYGFKFIQIKGWLPNDAQLFFPILLMSACLFFYATLYHLQHICKFMSFISALTLEIYIVQFACIRLCSSFTFPIRVLIVLLMIIAGAKVLQILRDFVVRMMEKGVKLLCRKN